MAELTFLQLTEQLQRLTQRVAALERELAGKSPIVYTEASLAQPDEQPTLPSDSLPTALPDDLPDSQPAPQQPRLPVRDLESSVGLRLVNRVGAVTLILGIAFFFRYAVENNWIGETARVLLGVLVGTLLLAGGEWAFRRGQKVFGQGVTGAGLAALFLSFYSAFVAYRLVPLTAALALMTATAVLAGFLALRYSSQAIALLAIFGGMLAPGILETKSLGEWFLPLYIALLDAGFLYLAERREWRYVQWAALAGTSIYSIEFGELPLRVFLPVYYLLFATRRDRWLFLTAHILVIARESISLGPFWGHASGLVGISLAGLGILRWRGWYQFSSVLVTVAWCGWLVMEINKTSPLEGGLATAALLYVMFLTVAIWRASTSSAELQQSSFEIAGFVSNPAFFFLAAFWKVHAWGDSRLALLALLLSALYLALAYWWRQRPAPNTLAAASAGIAVVFFTLAIPLQFHAFRITMAWALEGAALVWIAARRGSNMMRTLGFVVLVIAGLHFAWVDLTMYADVTRHQLIANARLATALVTGSALLLAAWWSRGTPVPVWLPGLGGHSVLLAGFSSEIDDWAALYHAPYYDSAQSAGISVLFAIYAVGLIGVGARVRSAASRYMGLALMAIVVVKLYVHDIWQLEMVYRFVAFAVLGALLLLVSFLYSRYRESVANWLGADAKPHAASEAHPLPRPE